MTRSIGVIVLLALLLTINAKAYENYDTLAPPPINFEREFVRIDGKVYEVTFKNNRLDIQEDPPWYREAIHNHLKRMYPAKEKLSKSDRFAAANKKISIIGTALLIGEVVVRILLLGSIFFLTGYFWFVAIKFILWLVLLLATFF